MVNVAESNAAFHAARAVLDTTLFKGVVHDDLVMKIVMAALDAADKERGAEGGGFNLFGLKIGGA